MSEQENVGTENCPEWVLYQLKEWNKLVTKYLPPTYKDRDNIGAIEALINRPTDAWIPVSERLPEQGQKVIATYVGVYDYRLVTYWEDSRPHFGSLNESDGKGSQPATHWQPLPPVPEED